jgi:glutamate formiminotransferase/formiminotetrahydrofolate cyclodeaminase
MVPENALLDAGAFYLQQLGNHTKGREQEIIQSAISSLGLNDKTPFDPQQKIIEYAMGRKHP